MTKTKLPSTVCAYCEKSLNKDTAIENNQKYHRLCLEAKYNVIKYFRGELPAYFYEDDDEEEIPTSFTPVKSPDYDVVYQKIKEYNQAKMQITWGEIQEEMHVKHGSRYLKQLIVEQKVKVTFPTSNSRKKTRDWNNAVVIAI